MRLLMLAVLYVLTSTVPQLPCSAPLLVIPKLSCEGSSAPPLPLNTSLLCLVLACV
jgi:hypothetical protein